MDKECLMCFSTIDKEADVTFISCEHSFCVHCAGEWISNHSTCPLDRIQIQFVKFYVGTNVSVIDGNEIVLLSNNVNRINSFTNDLPKFCRDNFSLTDIYNIKEETSHEEFNELLANFYDISLKMPKISEKHLSFYKNLFNHIHVVSNIVEKYDKQNGKTHRLLVYEFQIHLYKTYSFYNHVIIILKLVEESIISHKFGNVSRVQLIKYFLEFSQKLEKLIENFYCSLKLFEWLFRQVMVYFESFISKEMNGLVPHLTIGNNLEDSTFSSLERDIEIQNEMQNIQNMILICSEEEIDNYIFNDLFNLIYSEINTSLNTFTVMLTKAKGFNLLNLDRKIIKTDFCGFYLMNELEFIKKFSIMYTKNTQFPLGGLVGNALRIMAFRNYFFSSVEWFITLVTSENFPHTKKCLVDKFQVVRKLIEKEFELIGSADKVLIIQDKIQKFHSVLIAF